jgi:hypothetical protein
VQSQGTQYEIQRRIGAGGKFVIIGTVGKRKFIDCAVPPGARTIAYRITARRSSSLGPTAEFTINFGSESRHIGAFQGKRKVPMLPEQQPAEVSASEIQTVKVTMKARAA